jgi:hypothetical protein
MKKVLHVQLSGSLSKLGIRSPPEQISQIIVSENCDEQKLIPLSSFSSIPSTSPLPRAVASHMQCEHLNVSIFPFQILGYCQLYKAHSSPSSFLEFGRQIPILKTA